MTTQHHAAGSAAQTLDGRVALVTGGSRGIGAAAAIALAEAGADVAITFQRNAERARDVVESVEASGRRGVAIEADSADPAALRDAVERTASELGRLDVLVNNAGVSVQKALDEITLQEIELSVEVNVRGPFVAAQAAAAHLADGGRIINVASNAVERTPFAGMTLYSMTKSSLLGLTKGLARDLGPRGATANMVSPGPIDTEMNPADSPQAEMVTSLIPRGTYGTVEDVAQTVVHLAGAAGQNINGANIAIDGGITA